MHAVYWWVLKMLQSPIHHVRSLFGFGDIPSKLAAVEIRAIFSEIISPIDERVRSKMSDVLNMHALYMQVAICYILISVHL